MVPSSDVGGPLEVLRAFTVSKSEDAPNEDRWCVSDDKRKCAISDGASVSFDSAPWADLLTKRFVADPQVSPGWLAEAAAEYRANYDREAMPWMQQAAFDRGSFATLLGVVLSPEGSSAKAFVVGDCLLAFVDQNEIVRTAPYLTPEEFDVSPNLFSTSPAENRLVDETMLEDAWLDLNVSSHASPIILLLTDAVGRWLLDEPSKERVATLLAIDDATSFAAFVDAERREGRLRRDDSTMVIVGRRDELSPDH